jgi:prevent-host-death family protein
MTDLGKAINIHAAKTNFSQLVARAEQGEEIVISRGGKPVAKLVPIAVPAGRALGLMQGLFTVPADFDAPLSEDLLASFES